MGPHPANSTLRGALAIVAFCACGLPTHLASPGIPEGVQPDNQLITASTMGRVRLTMTLDDARRALPAATFTRTSDGEGAALVEITLGKDNSLCVWADEDDPSSPIDWSRQIVTIETFSPAFHTQEGIHPGSPLMDAVRFFGPVREIVKSEIEGRQYVTFARQPGALTFRLDDTGIFRPGIRRTTEFTPAAKIWSIAISSLS